MRVVTVAIAFFVLRKRCIVYKRVVSALAACSV